MFERCARETQETTTTKNPSKHGTLPTTRDAHILRVCD